MRSTASNNRYVDHRGHTHRVKGTTGGHTAAGRQEENGETSDAYMEYGLPPPRRIKPRRNRKRAKKQVHTMAKAEKVAPGSDWHIHLRTSDAEVWLQKNERVLFIDTQFSIL